MLYSMLIDLYPSLDQELYGLCYCILCPELLLENIGCSTNIWVIFKVYLFVYLFLAVLSLRCCVRAFSSCGKQRLLLVAVHRLLIAVASPVAEHGLQSAGSVVLAHGLSCSAACGIFSDQGSNLCPLHWQVDS